MYMDVHKEGTSLACGWEEAAVTPHNGESFFWKFLYLTNWEYDFMPGKFCTLTVFLMDLVLSLPSYYPSSSYIPALLQIHYSMHAKVETSKVNNSSTPCTLWDLASVLQVSVCTLALVDFLIGYRRYYYWNKILLESLVGVFTLMALGLSLHLLLLEAVVPKEALETYPLCVNLAFGVCDTLHHPFGTHSTLLHILFGSHIVVFPLFSAWGGDETFCKFNQQDLWCLLWWCTFCSTNLLFENMRSWLGMLIC